MRIKVKVTVISTGLFSVELSVTDELMIYARSPVLGMEFSCYEMSMLMGGSG
jgi:hypothetical protein